MLDCKRYRGIVEADGHIDAFGIEPAAGDCRADVGLVLVVGDGDLDRLAEHRTAASSTAMRAAIAEPGPPRSA